MHERSSAKNSPGGTNNAVGFVPDSGSLRYARNVVHKARYTLALGREDIRYRALAAAQEIAHVPEQDLPEDLRDERREILAFANRYDDPRISIRKKTASRLATRIYEFYYAIDTLRENDR